MDLLAGTKSWSGKPAYAALPRLGLVLGRKAAAPFTAIFNDGRIFGTQAFLSVAQVCNDMADGGYADDDMNDSILAKPSTSTEKDVETQSTTLGKVDSVLTDGT